MKGCSCNVSGNAGVALEELVACAHTLREFLFWRELQDPGAFEAIAKNAPLLKTVDISPDNEERLVDIVHTFAACRKLQKLIISDRAPEDGSTPQRSEKVANQFCRLRHRTSSSRKLSCVVYSVYLSQ